jgi:hypothetical protein
MKTYNLVLQSSVGTNGTPNETYFFDWGQLPQSRYSVQFTFNSADVAPTSVYVANLFLDLGQQQTTFMVASTLETSVQPRGNFLGSLSSLGSGANHYYFADLTTNPPIYLNNRPTNNNLFVEIREANSPFNTAFPDVGQYTLTLCFTQLDNFLEK